MSFKKLGRIATVAFVLAVILAVSAFAYGVDIAGNVTGLENGVEYTYAQYDFVNNVYVDESTLTPSTVITSGVWGIKAEGDEDFSPVFVYGAETGHLNHLDVKKLEYAAGTYQVRLDKNVEAMMTTDSNVAYLGYGKWSLSGMGNGSGIYRTGSSAFPKVYTNGTTLASVYFQIAKEKVAVWTTETIGEGEEATTVSKWIPRTDVDGDAILQSSGIYYGFTNEQVVPAADFEGFTSAGDFGVGFNGTITEKIFTPRITYYVKNVGSDAIGEYYYVSPNVGRSEKLVFGIPENMPEEGYIVGIRIQGYYNFTVEQLLAIKNSGSNAAPTLADASTLSHDGHLYLRYDNSNKFNVTLPVYAGPEGLTIVNGKVQGLAEGAKYEYCQVGAEAKAYALTADTFVYGNIKVRKCDASGTVASEWSDAIASDRTAVAAEFEIVDGKVSNLEDGILYQYTNVSVGNGKILAESEAAELTVDSEVYGLIKVREVNADGTAWTAWSDIVYCDGNDRVILNLSNTNPNGNPTYPQLYLTIEGTSYAIYSVRGEGKYYKKSNVWYDVETNEAWTGTAPAAVVYDTSVIKDVLDMAPLLDNPDNRATIQFTEGKWMGIGTTNYNLVLNYPSWYNAYRLGGTGNFTQTKENFNSFYYSYKLTPEEVMPMADFGSFSYEPYPRVFTTTFSGTIQSRFDLIVFTEDGVLQTRTAYVDHTMGNNGLPRQVKHTVSADQFTEKDGYIVGIVIYPWWVPEGVELTKTNGNNPSTALTFYADSLVVDEYVAAPTGLTIVDGKVQNLITGRTYEYCQVVGGVDGAAKALTADTVVYGDIKVRVYSAKGTNVVSEWSDAIASDRQAPTGIVFVDGKPEGLEEGILYTYITLTVGSATPGETTLPVEESEEVALTPASTGVYGLIKIREVNADGTAGTNWSTIIYSAGNDRDLINKETKQATRDTTDPRSGKVLVKDEKTEIDVLAIAKLGVNTATIEQYNEYRNSVFFATGKWAGIGAGSSFEASGALATAFSISTPTNPIPASRYIEQPWLAWKDNPEDPQKLADYKAACLEATKAYQDMWYSYRMCDDEIIPMKDFESFTFMSYVAGDSLTVTTGGKPVKSKVTFVVMTADGLIEKRSAYTAEFSRVSYSVNNANQTITLADFVEQGNDTDGYIVGIIIQPHGYMHPDVTYSSPSYSNSALYNSRLGVEFFENGFKTETDALTGITGGETINGLDPEKSYEYKQVSISADGKSLEGTWKTLDKNNIPVGLMSIREVLSATTVTRGTDLIYVYGDEEARKALGNIVDYSDSAYGGTKAADYATSAAGPDRYKAQSKEYFIQGWWTGDGANNYPSFTANMISPTGANYVSVAQATAARDAYNAYVAADEATKAEKAAAYEAAAQVMLDAFTSDDNWFGYAFDSDEIIPVSEVYSYVFNTKIRQGSDYTGEYTSKVVAYVAHLDGTLTEHVYVTEALKGGTQRTVDFTDVNAWTPKLDGGYLVALKFHTGSGMNDPYAWTHSTKNTMPQFEMVSYNIKAAPAAPTVSFVRLSDSDIQVDITNAVEGLIYAYSTDNLVWNTLEAGVTSFTVSLDTAKVYVKSLASGLNLESKVTQATVPVLKEKPQLTLGNDNSLTVEAGVYEIAQYAFTGEPVYADLVTSTLNAGLWLVRAKSDANGLASEPQMLFVRGESAGNINFVFVTGTDFVEGKWTVKNTTSGIRNYTKSTTDNSLYDWSITTRLEHHTTASNTYTLEERRNVPQYKYQFTGDEIVEVSKLSQIALVNTAYYHGYVNEGYSVEDTKVLHSRAVSSKGQTMARVYVVGADVEYYDVITENTNMNKPVYDFEAALSDKEGYVVAIELYPFYSVYGPDGKTDLGDDCVSACWGASALEYLSNYTYKMMFDISSTIESGKLFLQNELPEGETLPTSAVYTNNGKNTGYGGWYQNGVNRYALSIVKTPLAAPVINVQLGGNTLIKVANYNKAYTYSYSDDNGASWNALTGDFFYVTKPNWSYMVKVEAEGYDESVSEPVKSPNMIFIGTSVVLEDQIVIRAYFDVDEDAIAENGLSAYFTRQNEDYVQYKDYATNSPEYLSYRIGGNSYLDSAQRDWMSNIQKHPTIEGRYFLDLYVAAKDVDNIQFQTRFYVTDLGAAQRTEIARPTLTVGKYLDELKALADKDDSYKAAWTTAEKLQSYTSQADIYFKKDANAVAYAPKYDIADAEIAVSTCEDNLANLDFVGTSLLLEDNVTIRHYFKVVGDYTYTAGDYTSNGIIGIKNEGYYVYFDITDIPAHRIGDVQTLTVTGEDGKTATVTYSVANYLVNAVESSNDKLVNLANAMYDYYVEAKTYYNLTHN